jgi:hypothetical protein
MTSICNDILIGGSGRDILVGGMGSDVLVGGSGDDILISGTTLYDHNDLALRSIQTEWTSNDSYSTRVSNILGTAGNGQHLNGTYFLNGSTVQDDQSVDFLFDGSGHNWFFADTNGHTGPRDVVLVVRSGDTVTNI